ncbi:hypothetical protein CXIVA_19600 [Clostridium sp. SY8519]|uniref:leucine-rich repeat protein n=1 Tax=Clostridium sp. (strain SY8519) TaxID=1042156 RepID=UPI00021720F4|nr:leucine-rich repeat domain-containing protein [Clostridium sp. SY8519]BAK47927.1 hypothetical protein CXIVA_19600 [Clostridium sp. SY8519]
MNDQFEYEKTDRGIRLTKYIGNAAEVALPTEIDGEPVTILGSHAFFENGMDIRRILVPGTVKVIEAYACEFCLGLRELRLAEGVEELHQGFLVVSQQQELYIPSTVRLIEAPDELGTALRISPKNPWYHTDGYALYRRTEDGGLALEAVRNGAQRQEYEIPEGVTQIRAHAFDSQTALRRLTIPSTMREMAEGVLVDFRNPFNEESGITELILSPDNTSYFMEESGLYRHLPEGGLELIRYFGDQQDVIPAPEIRVIGRGAFAKSRIRRITIPSTIEKIYGEAFADCPLETVFFQAAEMEIFFPSIHPYLLKNALKGFGANGKLYDFSFYDRVLEDPSLNPEKVRMILCRLKYPENLPETVRETYIENLSEHVEQIAARQAEKKDLDGLKQMAEQGFFTAANVDRVIEILNRAHWQEGLTAVMNYKNDTIGNQAFDFSL